MVQDTHHWHSGDEMQPRLDASALHVVGAAPDACTLLAHRYTGASARACASSVPCRSVVATMDSSMSWSRDSRFRGGSGCAEPGLAAAAPPGAGAGRLAPRTGEPVGLAASVPHGGFAANSEGGGRGETGEMSLLRPDASNLAGLGGGGGRAPEAWDAAPSAASTQVRQARADAPSTTRRSLEQSAQTIFPQARQWCLLLVKVNS